MSGATPAATDLVLIGGGHSHLFVLKALGETPVPGLRITLIAKEVCAPYSGMIPGFVSGYYSHDDCHIDLRRLGAFAGARLIEGVAVGVDRSARRVAIEGRPSIPYGLLSIDVGITPNLDDIAGAGEHGFPVKPISTFAPRWQALEAAALRPGGPREIVVVGSGAAGFELVLAMRERLRTRAAATGSDPDAYRFTLIGDARVLPTHNVIARWLGRRALGRAGVAVIENDGAAAVDKGGVTLTSGRVVRANAVILVTRAAPPAWFAATGLPRTEAGYLAVRSTLQLRDDDDIFAAGDCAAVEGQPREKAGVFAVRQGPPLADNIRARAEGRAAKPFHMQRHFLTLLSVGGRRAIGARGPFAWEGDWLWRLKDRIDRKFMAKFRDLPGMAGE
jgi:selenide,water dikinase